MRDQIRGIKSAMIGAGDAEGEHGERAAVNKEGMLAELKGKFNRDVVGEICDQVNAAAGGEGVAQTHVIEDDR